jgi:hypothetical protein
MGARRMGLDELDESIALIDVDAGIAVSCPGHRRILDGAPAGFNSD